MLGSRAPELLRERFSPTWIGLVAWPHLSWTGTGQTNILTFRLAWLSGLHAPVRSPGQTDTSWSTNLPFFHLTKQIEEKNNK